MAMPIHVTDINERDWKKTFLSLKLIQIPLPDNYKHTMAMPIHVTDINERDWKKTFLSLKLIQIPLPDNYKHT